MFFFTSFRSLVIILPLMAVAVAKNAPPQLLPLDGQQSRIRIPLGTKSFKLTCPVRIGKDEEAEEAEELMIKWSKDGETLTPTESGDAQFRILNGDRDLRIRTPQLRDSGRYRCTAINEWGHRVVDFELEVFDPNGTGTTGTETAEGPGGSSLSENVSSPKWRDPSMPRATNVRLVSGAALHLRCPPSTGNPLPQVIWTREDVPVSLELTNPNAAAFSLDRVRTQDSARYSCLVQNQLGSIQADFHVLVTPSSSSAPAGSDDSDAQILFGHSVSGTFHASSASSSSSSALPLPPTPRIDHPPKANANGTASSVRAGHTAQLLCRVEWRREKSVIRWLRMVDNLEAMRVRVPNATILRLGEMTLMVLDQGNDAIRVELDPQGERMFVNELRIPNVQEEDSGRYFCVVTNPAGQFVYRSALLRVLPASPSGPLVLLLRLPPPLRVLLLIFLPLALILLPLLLYFRHRSRHSFFSQCCSFSSSNPHNSSSNTFSSSSSSSASSGSSKPAALPSASAILVPPPPPRMPPPGPPLLWPIHATTLERRGGGRGPVQSPPPHPLHRTERAEDEMSRMSSHIYASGSPLPPAHLPPPPHLRLFHPSASIYQKDPAPLPPSPSSMAHHHQKAQLPTEPPEPQRRGGGMRTTKRQMGAEEQRMPLIEAQRQSAELWHGN